MEEAFVSLWVFSCYFISAQSLFKCKLVDEGYRKLAFNLWLMIIVFRHTCIHALSALCYTIFVLFVKSYLY